MSTTAQRLRDPVAKPAQPALSPLAELNAHIALASHQARNQISADVAAHGPWPELRSVTRFRETWSRISAEEEVTHAVGRAPDNAGPLNSHMLVLRTLGLMRELSPNYLRRFMAHAETLLWLDLAGNKVGHKAKSPVGKAKVVRKKPAGKE